MVISFVSILFSSKCHNLKQQQYHEKNSSETSKNKNIIEKNEVKKNNIKIVLLAYIKKLRKY